MSNVYIPYTLGVAFDCDRGHTNLNNKNMSDNTKSWVITIVVLAIAITIGSFFGIELEKTIW
jgi:hypothetical protein